MNILEKIRQLILFSSTKVLSDVPHHFPPYLLFSFPFVLIPLTLLLSCPLFLHSSWLLPHSSVLIFEKPGYYLMMYNLPNENELFFYLQKDPISKEYIICIFSTFMCSRACLTLSLLSRREDV